MYLPRGLTAMAARHRMVRERNYAVLTAPKKPSTATRRRSASADIFLTDSDSTVPALPVSWLSLATLPMVSVTSRVPWAACWKLREISVVAVAVWEARLLTSPATTAKPRPASPAHAASMVAFRSVGKSAHATFVKSGGRRSANAVNASRASAVRRRCANCSPSACIWATSASPLRISFLVAVSAPSG